MREQRAESGKQKVETVDWRSGAGGSNSGGHPVQFLTRRELAEVLKISVRTVDTMLAGGELPHLRIHGNFIRFYLPDVVQHLTATALVSKRRWAGPSRKTETLKAE